jgi:hypothetical protein
LAAAEVLGVINIHLVFVSPIAIPTLIPNWPLQICRLFLSPTPSLGWLLYLPIDRQPPKAKAPIFSLFFDGVYVCTPNKGTDNGECETATGRLA